MASMEDLSARVQGRSVALSGGKFFLPLMAGATVIAEEIYHHNTVKDKVVFFVCEAPLNATYSSTAECFHYLPSDFTRWRFRENLL